MAVFTPVSEADARALLAHYDLGEFVAIEGIESGIENSNFFLSTRKDGKTTQYVLTLFEVLRAEQLPFYLNFCGHLAQFGLPAPAPKVDRRGRTLFELHGKPGAIVSKLEGRPLLAPEPRHCAQLGELLARMHVAAASFEGTQPNLRGLAWWQQVVPRLLGFLSAAERALIESELAFQTALADTPAYRRLPRSAVHADLFRDNAMFDGDRLSGVFDFYFAGVDTWLFDLCVCLNDWCIERASGALSPGHAQALLDAYDARRPLSADELELLPLLLRSAAMRFWVSRLYDLHLPRPAAMLKAHDPGHFERVLRARIEHPFRYARPTQPAASTATAVSDPA
jgi:homoserine kinase type II